MEKIWECPKCKRIFKKIKQQHSCAIYPVEKHLENKDHAKELYDYLKKTINEKVGPFIIESLPCCIHFVTKKAYTFAAVYAMKDRIRLHIASQKPADSLRIKTSSQISNTRYLYSTDILNKEEINTELIEQIRKAYHFAD